MLIDGQCVLNISSEDSQWGIYEIDKLSSMPEQYFREFVVRAFGGTPVPSTPGIHGYKGQLPLWVGKPFTTDYLGQVMRADCLTLYKSSFCHPAALFSGLFNDRPVRFSSS